MWRLYTTLRVSIHRILFEYSLNMPFSHQETRELVDWYFSRALEVSGLDDDFYTTSNDLNRLMLTVRSVFYRVVSNGEGTLLERNYCIWVDRLTSHEKHLFINFVLTVLNTKFRRILDEEVEKREYYDRIKSTLNSITYDRAFPELDL